MAKKKRLFLLEWRLVSSRVWYAWLILWAISAILLLNAALMSCWLLGHLTLPLSWFLLWLAPLAPGGVKYRLSEINGPLEHQLLWFGCNVVRWHSDLPDGLWSVDRVAGRYRLNRILNNGRIKHYLCRTADVPVFLHQAEVSKEASR